MKKLFQTNQVVGYYLQHVKRYKLLVAGVFVSVPLTVLFNTFFPSLILASILTRLSQGHYSHSIMHSFGPTLAIYFVLILVGIFTWRLVDLFVFQLEARVEKNIAEEVFNHLLEETADFHSNNFSGSLVSQANKLLGGYIRMADTTFFQVFPLIFSLTFTAIILAPRAPLYTFLLIVFAIFFVLAAFKVSGPVMALSSEHASNESIQTGFLADAITNVMIIKSFARQAYENKRFSKATQTTAKSLLSYMREQRRLFNYMGFISRSMSAMALVMAIVSVVIFKSNIGTVFLIVSFTGSVVEQLFNFANSSLRNYNRSIGDATDMVEILARTPEIQDPLTPDKSLINRGAITFKDVTFAHNESDSAIIEHFNLSIKAGEKIGLVGHSGSGKTTLARLILRFSDIDSGQILIDGQNISAITQDDLHEKIAYVPQEPLLFHRTIAENIAYGQELATNKAITTAAKHAHVSEFIDLLPKRYDTLVGERGVKLSGGQRQRVAIARALLKNAPILVLDEATSSLDSESEILIQDALWKLMEGRTALVIAHRLSTIQKMDRILVLENGEVIEDGTHQDLLNHGGTYAKLWNHQSGGFIDED